ncbi:MAG: NAD(P)H-binding protein [Gammaproteobacteria bacterium]|nr:NAD(P)H-binding protein [Gammaproteobacteria bacterium]
MLLSACVSIDRQPASLPDVDSSIVPRKNITIAMLGATGMAGGFIVQEALAQGYDIRALARTPQKLYALKDQITIVEGDARDHSTIDMLLQGSNIVISALGPTKADGDASKTISTTATGHIIQLMPAHNINRYILVSGAAVDVSGDERNLTGWLIQKMAFLALHDTVKDKQAEYQLLADSYIQWTLVRCPLIKDKPFKHQPKTSLVTPSSFSLRAGELAHFMIEQINSGEFIKKAPFLESQ